MHMKTAPKGSNSGPYFGQPEVVTVPEGQSSDTKQSSFVEAEKTTSDDGA